MTEGSLIGVVGLKCTIYLMNIIFSNFFYSMQTNSKSEELSWDISLGLKNGTFTPTFSAILAYFSESVEI